MELSDITDKVMRSLHASFQISRMPRIHLRLQSKIHPEHIAEMHRTFTKPHARYPLIKNKTVGVAVLDLRMFKTPQDYLDTVKKRDYAGYHARRSKLRGYRVSTIDRNQFVDDIHAINTSEEARQGRPMDDTYRVKQTVYEDYPHYDYYGVIDKQDKLVGYCNLATLGDFAATERLIGYKNTDGFMYLLLTEIICSLIEQKAVSFLMYDSYMGAQAGLRSFKRRAGFRPCLVRYSVE